MSAAGKNAVRMEPPPMALRILDVHGPALDAAGDEASKKTGSAQTLLGAAATVLSQRQKYFGAVGEHFSVQEYDGIQIIDRLDERLLRALRGLLRRWLDRTSRKPDPKALEFLAQKLTPGGKELPQYPVAYVVYFLIVTSLQNFDALADQGGDFGRAELEVAMVQHLDGILERYLQTRDKPVTRHFSDVAREYTVVMRLKCSCGAEKLEVKLQALCQTGNGEWFDRLDLQCGACSAQRAITFDLPHFKDMYSL